MGGWAAWKAGALRKHLAAQAWLRSPGRALGRALSPGAALGVAAYFVTAAAVTGVGPNRLTIFLFGWAALAVLASVALGALLAMVLRRAIAAPTAMVALFAWFALPLGSLSPWLRGSNTASAMGTCCTMEQQIAGSTIFASSFVSLTTIVMSALLLSRQRSRSVWAVGLVGTLGVAATGSWIMTRDADASGLSERSQQPVCEHLDETSVCVWPEHTSALRATLMLVEEVRSQLGPFGVAVPNHWSESSILPAAAAFITVPDASTEIDRRFTISLSIIDELDCAREDAALTAFVSLHAGVPIDDLRLRIEPSAVDRASGLLGLPADQQRAWFDARAKDAGCR
ncbi:hypothetical protein CAE01nite_20580 [Cellulomonas aerilata]|uniref:DUF7224 domain-containing protein n=2 Tax=Cellulomonas aerilata TaxID=515326 RepID=A0A512DCZ1_9CELL|nr:hypothetical protein CAE01nite_20580 [Cellulomonas aerilata]